MKKSISVNKKSRGRPKKKGGVYPVTAVRLSPTVGAEVDKWAANEADRPTRSEAIRRLVELGLKASVPERSTGKPGQKARAQELATKAIDGMQDPAAPTEEKAQRRRRLTKGPAEFRDDCVDLPKAKAK